MQNVCAVPAGWVSLSLWCPQTFGHNAGVGIRSYCPKPKPSHQQNGTRRPHSVLPVLRHRLSLGWVMALCPHCAPPTAEFVFPRG